MVTLVNTNRNDIRFPVQFLVEIDFLHNFLAAHVTRLQRFGAPRATAVAAQKCNVPFTFHANAARTRLLEFHDFALQIPQPIHVRGWPGYVIHVHLWLNGRRWWNDCLDFQEVTAIVCSTIFNQLPAR